MFPRTAPLLCFLAACTSEAPAPTAPPREMSAEVRWVPARPPRARALLEAPARVVAEDPAAAEITVLHSGRVLRFHLAAGDVVEAGAPVADLQIPAVAEAAARLDALEAQIGGARARLADLERLEKEGLARAAELFALRTQIGSLLATRNEAQAVLRTYGLSDRDAGRVRRDGHLTLRTPAGGVVTARAERLGRVVSPGDPPLAVIEGPRPARIQASLPGALPEGGEVDFVGQDGRVLPLRPEPLSTWADGRSGRITAWLAPAKPAALPDGLAGRVRVAPPKGAVEVPSGALIEGEDGAAVLVLRGEAHARVPVEVLLDSGTSALVRGDLAVGDAVAQDAERVAR